MNPSGARCKQVGALQPCKNSVAAFAIFTQLRLCLTQFIQGTGTEIVSYLDGLQPGFTDAAGNLSHFGGQLTGFTAKAGPLTLQRQNSGFRNQATFDQGFNIGQFFRNECGLGILCRLLRYQTPDLIFILVNPFIQLIQPALNGRILGLQETLLARQQCCYLRIILTQQQVLVEDNFTGKVTFGLKTGDLGQQFKAG